MNLRINDDGSCELDIAERLMWRLELVKLVNLNNDGDVQINIKFKPEVIAKLKGGE